MGQMGYREYGSESLLQIIARVGVEQGVLDQTDADAFLTQTVATSLIDALIAELIETGDLDPEQNTSSAEWADAVQQACESEGN